jgi:hypothetical protein
MDAKIWTFGATLFALLYLSLGVYLDIAAFVVALFLAAWVLAFEVEHEDGAKYVAMELRPALAFVGIFGLTVVVLGPYFPPLIGPTLGTVQYALPLAILHDHPVWFFFPMLPFITGTWMSVYQSQHPVAGIVFRPQTGPVSSSTKVHVHLHHPRSVARTRRAAEADDEESDDEDEDDEDDVEEEPKEVPHRSHSKVRGHPLKAVDLEPKPHPAHRRDSSTL